MPGAVRRHGERFTRFYLAFAGVAMAALVVLVVVLLLRVDTVTAQIRKQELATCTGQNNVVAHAIILWTYNAENTPGESAAVLAKHAAEVRLVHQFYKPIYCPKLGTAGVDVAV